ncbi:MAG: FKBP-type peptidyl-prolyl cis-trans isomerase [Longimicrobiales bacterium]
MAMLLVLAACSSSTDVDDRWANPETISYAPSLNIDISKMNRTPIKRGNSTYTLFWQDIVVGEADTAKVGDNVRVHYTGWLPDGTEFDSTRGRDPIEFLLGLGFVMPGFDGGVIGMRIGGVRRLVIRPELAFGNRGRPEEGIPAATTVVVEVERLTTPAH